VGRQTDCPTYEGIRQTELQIGRWMNGQTDRHIDRLPEEQKRDKKERKTNKHMNRKRNLVREKWMDRWTYEG
jgi:hypothetical protein